MLNDVRVNIPSIRVKMGDNIKLHGHSKDTEYFKHLDDNSPAPASVPAWMKVNRKKIEATVVGMPTRDDAELDINEQLIVEYYSR
jgi:small subunit ribosomal protein S4